MRVLPLTMKRNKKQTCLYLLLFLIACGVVTFINAILRTRQIEKILNKQDNNDNKISVLSLKEIEKYIIQPIIDKGILVDEQEVSTLPPKLMGILEDEEGIVDAEQGNAIVYPTETAEQQRIRRLKEILKCNDHQLESEKIQYGSYWLLRNIFIGETSRNIGCAEAITLTTIGDYTFFENLPLLVSRWLAPISFAVYAPGYDINATLTSIQYVRNCLPESMLITSYVSFHIYFPANNMPAYIPLNDSQALDWPYDCEAITAPYEKVDRSKMYKSLKNLTYPINVARNIARKSVNTYFIFASDIELIPSTNLSEKFLDLVLRNQSAILSTDTLRVFPLPVFELDKNAPIPDTKTQLVEMLHTHMAFPFHSKVCRYCHFVPGQSKWVVANETDELSIFTVGKREGEFKYWEPFYISNNKEPVFDERVTWEGQSNKRIQNFAMCLLGYEYNILHPAFLVHSPGIKYFNHKDPRLKFVPAMNRLIKRKIEPEYRILYGRNKNCVT